MTNSLKMPPPEMKKPADHVRSLLVVICILCGALAAYYYSQAENMRAQIGKLRRAPDARQDAGTIARQSGKLPNGTESGRVFDLVDVMAQRDKAMNELRQRLAATKGGRTSDSGLSTNTLPKSVRLTHNRKVSQPTAETKAGPGRRGGRSAPLFPHLSEQDAFFRELDVSSMTPEEQKSHDELLQHLLALRSLMLVTSRVEESAWQAAVMREAQAVDKLMPAVRRGLLAGIGRDLGYDGESSRWFAEYLDQIGRMTTFSVPSEIVMPDPSTSFEGVPMPPMPE